MDSCPYAGTIGFGFQEEISAMPVRLAVRLIEFDQLVPALQRIDIDLTDRASYCKSIYPVPDQ